MIGVVDEKSNVVPVTLLSVTGPSVSELGKGLVSLALEKRATSLTPGAAVEQLTWPGAPAKRESFVTSVVTTASALAAKTNAAVALSASAQYRFLIL